MPNWRQIARDRVFTLGLEAGREADLVEELAGQMEELYGAGLDEGMSADAALRRALAALPAKGDFGRARWAGFLKMDAGFGWRLYARQPAFLLAAVLAIGVGIGACATVFSLLEAVVLRPLDYRNPSELVMVWESFRGGADNVVSAANYLEWRKRTNVLAAASPVISLTRNLVGVGEPVELGIEAVGWDYLRMLGVSPELGRDFVEDDDRPETPAAVLLSHRLWKSRFGGDSGVLGRKLQLDGLNAVVVGVLPAGFASLSEDPDLLTTARLDPTVDYRSRGRFMRAVGRLKPAVTLAAAQAELAQVARRLEEERPLFNKGWTVRLTRLEDHFSRNARGGLWLLMAAVALVLLIVCGNVANLLLARAGQRQRELAVRWALGAAPARLAGQLLTESLLLAMLGGALGLALAWAGVQLVRTLAPVEIPRWQSAGLDWRVVLFSLVVTVLAAAAFGGAPALAAWRVNPVESLKEGSRTVAGGGGRWRGALVVAQTALALALLLAAGTLMEQFRALAQAAPGFDPRGVVAMSLILPDTKYREAAQVAGFYAELERRLARLPEVRQVGAVAWLPLAGPGAATGVYVAGRPQPAPGEMLTADVRMATPGYFAAMGIPLLAGRALGKGGLVVSRSLAALLFPQGDAVGRRLVVNMREHDAPMEIVGVVGDVRHAGLGVEPRPMVYYAHADFAVPMMTVVMRTQGPVASAAVATVREMDAGQPVRSVRTMEEWVARSVAERRLVAQACSAFAASAVALACMGVYGAFVQVVEERRHELGVRLALGAEPADVLWLVARQALGLLGAGVAGGLLILQLAARSWGLPPNAGLTVVMSFAFISLAMAAVVMSVRRALHLNPLTVLRQE